MSGQLDCCPRYEHARDRQQLCHRRTCIEYYDLIQHSMLQMKLCSLYKCFGREVQFKKYLHGLSDAGTRLLAKYTASHEYHRKSGSHTLWQLQQPSSEVAVGGRQVCTMVYGGGGGTTSSSNWPSACPLTLRALVQSKPCQLGSCLTPIPPAASGRSLSAFVWAMRVYSLIPAVLKCVTYSL